MHFLDMCHDQLIYMHTSCRSSNEKTKKYACQNWSTTKEIVASKIIIIIFKDI